MDFFTVFDKDVKPNPKIIRNIEWDMMDKTKFFPLSMLSSFSVRCALYPLTLIKTRLQVQKHNDLYTGMFDAYGKIYRYEGFSGLYRGFWVSSVQIVSGVFYISTYEGVRHVLKQNKVNSNVRALLGGAAASLVSQTLIVPFDVLSQHLMMMGISGKEEKAFSKLGMQYKPYQSKLALTIDLARHIFKVDGIMGFYRASQRICLILPCGGDSITFTKLFLMMPSSVSHLLVQSISGTLGGFSTTVLTNPLDVVRARLQVDRIGSMRFAFGALWAEEGMGMFTKGLSARLVQSATFSFSIIVGYETIKRVSVSEEYKQYIRW